jgi:hypothetical protein
MLQSYKVTFAKFKNEQKAQMNMRNYLYIIYYIIINYYIIYNIKIHITI